MEETKQLIPTAGAAKFLGLKVIPNGTRLCDACGANVKLTDWLNETREGNDARVCSVDAKLDIVIERLGIHAATVEKPIFPTRPKRFKDMPAFVFKNVGFYVELQVYG